MIESIDRARARDHHHWNFPGGFCIQSRALRRSRAPFRITRHPLRSHGPAAPTRPMQLVLVLVTISLQAAAGFALAGLRPAPSASAACSRVWMSDEGAEEEVTSLSKLDGGSVAKEALKEEVGEGLSGRPDRAVVGEILLGLEARNPTSDPAASPLLNGKWKFVYASGATPGLSALRLLLKSSKLAPKSPSGAEIVDVQDAYLTISTVQPRATSSIAVRVLSLENTLKLSSNLEAESGVRLVESYEAAESEYMGLKLPLNSSPRPYKRSVLVTYLDDELLVVRDSAECVVRRPHQ